MILYHFTCRAWFHFIETQGITKGEAPISLTEVEQHPNLTSNPDPFSQPWQSANKENRKNAVRITVEIDDNDPLLISWKQFAISRKMDKKTYRKLDEKGGWQARNWWIYLGIVTTDKFLSVDYFDDGKLSPIELKLLHAAMQSASSEEALDKVGAIKLRPGVKLEP